MTTNVSSMSEPDAWSGGNGKGNRLNMEHK